VMQAVVIGLYLLPYTQTIDWLNMIAFILMLLTMAVTVLTGLEYIYKAAKLRSAARAK
jgi:CDP-diacylglycerol--glycerol-3-phosphate 3-phosphatidyltransferase